jgi:hypothetical protein
MILRSEVNTGYDAISSTALLILLRLAGTVVSGEFSS